MTALMIDANALKTVRKARKLGRPRVAKETGLSERQIARLEGVGSKGGDVPLAAALRLAHVLQVPVETLTGELQVSDAYLAPAAKPSCSCCG